MEISQQIPEKLERRLREWRFMFKLMHRLHYIFGVIGIAAAASPAIMPEKATYFAFVSGLCLAVLGFVQPDRQYLRFVRAWRRLDIAIQRREAGLIDNATLYNALEAGESEIRILEDEDLLRPKPTAAPDTQSETAKPTAASESQQGADGRQVSPDSDQIPSSTAPQPRGDDGGATGR